MENNTATWITPAVQAAMDRGCAHIRIDLRKVSDQDLTEYWYMEYTGKMTCAEYIAYYNRMRKEGR